MKCECDDPYSYLSVDDFIDGELAVLVTTFIGYADFTLLAYDHRNEKKPFLTASIIDAFSMFSFSCNRKVKNSMLVSLANVRNAYLDLSAGATYFGQNDH